MVTQTPGILAAQMNVFEGLGWVDHVKSAAVCNRGLHVSICIVICINICICTRTCICIRIRLGVCLCLCGVGALLGMP